MAQTTKIKSDFLGLYVNAGGYKARPFYGTVFNEGDEVKTHHFGNSINAGVTIKTENFTKKGNYEIWCTAGDYGNLKTKSELQANYDWYKNNTALHSYESFINTKHNDDFHAFIDPMYNNSRKYNL